MKTTFVFFLIALCACTIKADQFSITGLALDFWPCNDKAPSGDNSILECGQGITVAGESKFNCRDDPKFKCHVDFQRHNGEDKGIAKTTLRPEPNNFPELDTANHNPSITNATWYSYFFRRVEGMNKAYNVNLTLTSTGTATGEYFYETDKYYPIDGRGFGNYARDNQGKGVYRNYHFTFQLRSNFVYRGGETFKYRGDDDLWVFINNTLRIDLGGVHSPLEAEVSLDTLGLTKGRTYPIDIFFCERHTYGSNFRVYTTMGIYCPWEDHCGVCQGDGQSCCMCNDNNPCTKDTCDVLSGNCTFTPDPVCTPPNFCTNSYCNTNTGSCVHEPIVCNDGKDCTQDNCIPSAGCSYTPIVCNDNNACTSDLCQEPGGCTYANISHLCNDNDPCTIDSCVPSSGCRNIPRNCDDGLACTLDSCDSTRGGCIHEQRECSDGNACTLDLCSNVTGCFYPTRSCDDGNPCTIDSCNPLTGCVYQNRTCNDGNLCTEDYCEDGCKSRPINCTDNDECTRDWCDLQTGQCMNVNQTDCSACALRNITCDDGDACHPGVCFDGECSYDPIDCNDNDPCTYDYCEEGLCLHDEYESHNSTACVPMICNRFIFINAPVFEPKPKICDDYNLCTTDYCNETSGECHFEPVICETSLCHPRSCFMGNCVGEEINCDDRNACTIDECVDGECVHEPILCENSTACHPLRCTPSDGICRGSPVDCNDANACTIDTCSENGTCIYGDVTCDDGNPCTIDSCNPLTGCTTLDLVCDDNNKCTIDSCDNSTGCVYTPVDLDEERDKNVDKCFTYICNNVVGVIVTPIVCRPTDKCKCIPETGNCECQTNLLGQIGTTEAAIGAGAIAAIVIGVAAFLLFIGVGSKKGYDYFRQKDLMTGQVMSSGLYEASGKDFTSALYEGRNDDV